MNRINKLKKIINEKGCARILEAHNGLCGRIIEKYEQIDGLWESSLTDSGSKGLPDTELVTMDSRCHTIREILDVSTKPMIVDGDTGGQIDHFPYWVKRLESLGVSAVIIEDKAFPKQNSLDENAKHILEDIDKFCAKIKAGVEAKTNPDFMVIARLESLIAKKSMFDALTRAEAFLNAGADGIMIHSKAKIDASEVLEFADRYKHMVKDCGYKDKVLVCVPTTYNHINDIELKKAGFNIIIHANHMLRSSLSAMDFVAGSIAHKQGSKFLDGNIAEVQRIFELTGYKK